jgi:hypothetical protein
MTPVTATPVTATPGDVAGNTATPGDVAGNTAATNPEEASSVVNHRSKVSLRSFPTQTSSYELNKENTLFLTKNPPLFAKNCRIAFSQSHKTLM